MAALQSVQFIAQHIKDEDKDNEVSPLRYKIFLPEFPHKPFVRTIFYAVNPQLNSMEWKK